ncbi:MAG TPA: polyprenyl synthetase family protein [Thermomicrobiales bacterium]
MTTNLEDSTLTHPAPPLSIDVDELIEPRLAAAVATLDDLSPLLGGMARYHLGWVDERLTPLGDGAADRGKRIRPSLALLSCAAAGGDPYVAAPLAAAVELLHNFTLVHDDIQDGSPSRRHRPTVWSLWGAGQAINAGDALFAASQLALLRLAEAETSPALTLRLATAYNLMTIDIVGGQVLDLGFEGRDDVTPADYLAMIGGKTAAIVRFAAWGGALLAGASDDVADRFGAFGRALGLGFQIRDDLLGIWGRSEVTGKADADDIRRRKQSLPILVLRQRADASALAELNDLYGQSEIDAAGVRRVLALLAAHDVRTAIESEVRSFHDQARQALFAATGEGPNPARDILLRLVESLASREG